VSPRTEIYLQVGLLLESQILGFKFICYSKMTSTEEKPVTVSEEHDASSCRRTVSLPVQKVPLSVIRFASSLASIFWGNRVWFCFKE